MLADDPCQGAKGLIDFSRTLKDGGHVRVKHDDTGTCRIPGGVFVGPSVAEIVLWEYLVDLSGSSGFTWLSLHSLSARVMSRVGR